MKVFVNGISWQTETMSDFPVEVVFHGFVEEGEHSPSGNSCSGEFFDAQGNSCITKWNWDVNESVLTFHQKYPHMEHPVIYSLKEVAPRVFDGTWQYGDEHFVIAEGMAHLLLTPPPDGFFDPEADLSAV